ncbi:MAG: hypothetical protein K2Y71_23990 [Xanthobacteraceae bacterium]|nr:hypothetical protein [Xanthobacteraceae bacterium]
MTSVKALVLALACSGFAAAASAQSLTPVEEQLAARIAGAGAIEAPAALHPDAVSARGTPNRVVVSRVEAVRTDNGSRLAVVTTYQYEGNITTNRMVDLDTNAIVSERTSTDTGTPVGTVEADYARSLLMSDARIQELIAPFQGAVDIGLIPTVITDPSDPLYGRRIVRAVINTPQGFVTGVQVSVNLSDATVSVQQQ